MNAGVLFDSSGQRYEYHTGTDYIVDTKRLWATLWRLGMHDFHAPLETALKNYPLRPFKFLGMVLQPNIRFVYSRSRISSVNGGVRDKQKTYSLSFTF